MANTQGTLTTEEQVRLLRCYLSRAATARLWMDAGRTKDDFVTEFGDPEYSAAAWDIAADAAHKELRLFMAVIAN